MEDNNPFCACSEKDEGQLSPAHKTSGYLNQLFSQSGVWRNWFWRGVHGGDLDCCSCSSHSHFHAEGMQACHHSCPVSGAGWPNQPLSCCSCPTILFQCSDVAAFKVPFQCTIQEEMPQIMNQLCLHCSVSWWGNEISEMGVTAQCWTADLKSSNISVAALHSASRVHMNPSPFPAARPQEFGWGSVLWQRGRTLGLTRQREAEAAPAGSDTKGVKSVRSLEKSWVSPQNPFQKYILSDIPSFPGSRPCIFKPCFYSWNDEKFPFL